MPDQENRDLRTGMILEDLGSRIVRLGRPAANGDWNVDVWSDEAWESRGEVLGARDLYGEVPDPDVTGTVLEPGMIFRDIGGEVVRLDRRVEGDGSQWHVAVWSCGGWDWDDRRVEPDDLDEIAPDPEAAGPGGP